MLCPVHSMRALCLLRSINVLCLVSLSCGRSVVGCLKPVQGVRSDSTSNSLFFIVDCVVGGWLEINCVFPHPFSPSTPVGLRAGPGREREL